MIPGRGAMQEWQRWAEDHVGQGSKGQGLVEGLVLINGAGFVELEGCQFMDGMQHLAYGIGSKHG
jgi:hypothetical protein